MKTCKTNKECKISFCLSIVFFVSMIYFSVWKNKENNSVAQTFQETLLPSQKQIYEMIKKERRNIYIQGYVLGFVISLGIVYLYRNTQCMTRFSVLCMVFSVSFMVNYFYYILSPKTTYMVEHLRTQEQRRWWVRVYRQMQYNYHLGFVFGIAALVLFTNGICI